MASTHLTPPERETVVLMDDDSDVAHISTWQRRIITRLEKNPLARKIEDMQMGSTVGARFELPAAMISFRSKRRTGGTGNPDALARARQHVNAATPSKATGTTGTGQHARSRGLDSTGAGADASPSPLG